MKRAKIMLIAIAVVATVGGALAFKAQKFAFQNVYCKAANGTCPLQPFKTVAAGNPGVTTPCINIHQAGTPFTTSYYTTSTCPSPIPALVTTELNP